MTDHLLETFRNVDPRLRPNMSTVTNVTAQLEIIDLGPVRDLKEEYKLSLFLRLKWKDERLAWRHSEPSVSPLDDNNTHPIKELRLNWKFKNEMWFPDIFFRNAKEEYFHINTSPNLLIRITGDGEITTSSRISATVKCLMNFSHFPFDVHTCKLIFSSYQYSKSELWLSWDEHIPALVPKLGLSKRMNGYEPPRPTKHQALKLFDFNLVDVSISSNLIKTNTGDYTTLMLCFKFERDLRYYIVNSYLYPFTLVCLSQVSFWINTECTPARMTFGSMGFLSLTLFTMTEREFVPKVAYATAYDYYLSTCFLFVAAACIEVSIVNYFTMIRPKRILNSIVKEIKKKNLNMARRARRLSSYCRKEDFMPSSIQEEQQKETQQAFMKRMQFSHNYSTISQDSNSYTRSSVLSRHSNSGLETVENIVAKSEVSNFVSRRLSLFFPETRPADLGDLKYRLNSERGTQSIYGGRPGGDLKECEENEEGEVNQEDFNLNGHQATLSGATKNIFLPLATKFSNKKSKSPAQKTFNHLNQILKNDKKTRKHLAKKLKLEKQTILDMHNESNIDVYARWIFPLAFGVFNIAYVWVFCELKREIMGRSLLSECSLDETQDI